MLLVFVRSVIFELLMFALFMTVYIRTVLGRIFF